MPLSLPSPPSLPSNATSDVPGSSTDSRSSSGAPPLNLKCSGPRTHVQPGIEAGDLDLGAATLPLDDLSPPSDGHGPPHGGAGLWGAFARRPHEGWGRYAARLCSEGHSIPDAFLTVAASQIGQVMLVAPNALWKVGLAAGSLWMAAAIAASFFTIHLINVLFMEYRRAKLDNGTWAKRHVTQYHDVMTFHAGKAVGCIAQALIVLQLAGGGVAQILACATDWYAVDKSRSKRELLLIWGAVLQVVVVLPSFGHFRVLNILALTGTTMTAAWLLVSASAHGYADRGDARLWPTATAKAGGAEDFFTGAAVVLSAVGGHAIAVEMMDAMESPKHYTAAYSCGLAWALLLIVPPSFCVNLAFPSGATGIGSQDNVYSILPVSRAMIASVALMTVHQLGAFAYYLSPVFYIWERAIGTHSRPWYIRLPSRLPITLFVWLIALAFPFYGAINALVAALSVPFTAFALPCAVFWWAHRGRRRESSAAPKGALLQQDSNCTPAFAACLLVGVLFLGFGLAASAYAVKAICHSAAKYGVFARCHQCPTNYTTLLANPGNRM